MKKRDNVIILLLLFFLLVVTTVDYNNRKYIKTDSGWDSSYDSGGGWSSSDSGGSWSSGGSSHDWSSHDSSSRRSSSSGSSAKSSPKDIATIIVVVIFMLLIFGGPYMVKDLENNSNMYKPKKTPRKYGTALSKYEEFMANYDNIMESLEKQTPLDVVEDEEIAEFFPDETRESLIDKLFDKFINVQYAWMEFDYEKLRTLCSDELYNTYIAQLDALKLKNGKNIMHDFEFIVSDITGLKEQDGLVIIDCFLKVSFYDYVINAKTGKVIRGDKDRLFVNTYRLQFIIEKDKLENKCPNCGAVSEDVTSGKCKYCGSDYVIKPKDFVLNRKEIIR